MDPRPNRRLKFAAALVALALGTLAPARAYILESSAWPMGKATAPTAVTMQLQLQSGGPANRTLIDGSTSWNQVAAAALTDWNQYLVTMQYKYVMDSTAPVSSTESSNGFNNVSWSSTIYGEDWGSAVGITIRYYQISGTIYPTTEADVLFDSGYSWDSYRGPLQSFGDLHRVAIHEFGHVLGLDHPDDYGQVVSAVMNRAESNTDDLTADDLGGGGYLYNLVPSITSQPSSLAATPGSAVTLSVVTTNNYAANFQWQFNGTAISGATSASYVLNNVQAANQGNYRVLVSDRAGTTTSNIASLAIVAGPAITSAPASQTVSAGAPVNLSVSATGNNLSYQWLLNGSAIAGATSSTYSIPAAGALDAGSYVVVVSNGVVSSSPAVAVVTVNTNARLINLSTRANVGATSLTAGYVIGGTGTKDLLFRGIGPALASFGLTGVLSQPLLTLYNSSGAVLATDSGWGDSAQFQQAFAAVGAFALPPNSADTAILASNFPQGSATVSVSGRNGTQGNALIEVWDEDAVTAPARLVNLSVLAFSDTGAGSLTAGFVVSGTTSLTLLVRGDGPSLSVFGVPGVLAQPVLSVFPQSGPAIATNTGWGGDAKLTTAFSQAAAFPFTSSSADSALLVTLAPGSYTAQVSGVNNTTGTAEIEIYELR